MTRHTLARIVALAALCLACEDPLGVQVGETWTLDDVDGQVLPAIVEPYGSDAVSVRYLRAVARTIELVSADSAVYAEAWDIAEVRRNTSTYPPQPIAAACTRLRVGWRRAGQRVILEIPALGTGEPPARDTLVLSGRTLVQRVGPDSVGEFRRLAYERRAPESPVCPPAE